MNLLLLAIFIIYNKLKLKFSGPNYSYNSNYLIYFYMFTYNIKNKEKIIEYNKTIFICKTYESSYTILN